ncbi:MAG: hypothetical protein AAFY17_14705, partial [Cyanobacteria bacterium J06642_11]
MQRATWLNFAGFADGIPQFTLTRQFQGRLSDAIAEAQKIELGRALRVDAQTKVAQWTKQIQVL